MAVSVASLPLEPMMRTVIDGVPAVLPYLRVRLRDGRIGYYQRGQECIMSKPTPPASQDKPLFSFGPDRRRIASPNPKPCNACPWRRTSAGPVPNMIYTYEEERPRVWDGIGDGTPHTCHLTDERLNEFEPRLKVPEDRPVHFCTGAAVLVARELDRLENEFGGNRKAYIAANPNGPDIFFGGGPSGAPGACSTRSSFG